MGISRSIVEIAMALIALALAGLLINRSKNTSEVVTSVASAYGSLLQTATAAGAGRGISY